MSRPSSKDKEITFETPSCLTILILRNIPLFYSCIMRKEKEKKKKKKKKEHALQYEYRNKRRWRASLRRCAVPAAVCANSFPVTLLLSVLLRLLFRLKPCAATGSACLFRPIYTPLSTTNQSFPRPRHIHTPYMCTIKIWKKKKKKKASATLSDSCRIRYS